MSDQFERVNLDDIPTDPSGNCLVDLYVHLPTSNRYVLFVSAGDRLEEDRKLRLQDHVVPELFVLQNAESITSTDGKAEGEEVTIIRGDKKEAAEILEFKNEIVGKKQQEELKQIFTNLLDPNAPTEQVLERIESKAAEIVDAVAPETKDLKESLMQNMKYIHLMNDASAISSIAIMIALANGFDSQKSFRDLAYACIVMDAALVEFPPEVVEQYYKDRSQLPPDVLKRFLQHPIRSHELASQKIKSLSDVTLQLILNHHELYNGKGYPKGNRSESLFPMVKILAFAVDIFEHFKKSELNDGPVLQFPDVIYNLQEEDVEPHLRRHNSKLVQTVLSFMKLDPKNRPETPAS